MEKPPLFQSFKRFGMAMKGQITTAAEEKDWGWLFAYLVVIIIVAATSFFLIVGAVVSGLEAIGLIKENISAPNSELTYEKISENRSENGEYTTVFNIKFSNPMGQTGGTLLYTYPQGCSTNNNPLLIGGGELKNGTLYAVSKYEVTCVTRELITDNGNLFKLKN